MLANGINGAALAQNLVLLTIILNGGVAFLEAWVLKIGFQQKLRSVFIPLFVANTFSSLAGWLINITVERRLYHHFDTLGFCIRRFWLLGLGMILLYWLASVAVEGVWMTRRKLLERLSLSRPVMWKAVLWANLVSYVLIAPAYYLLSRPVTTDLSYRAELPASTDNESRIYFLNADNRVSVIRPDGSGYKPISPDAATEFVIALDAGEIAYRRVADGKFWSCALDGGNPAPGTKCDYLERMTQSPDGAYILEQGTGSGTESFLCPQNSHRALFDPEYKMASVIEGSYAIDFDIVKGTRLTFRRSDRRIAELNWMPPGIPNVVLSFFGPYAMADFVDNEGKAVLDVNDGRLYLVDLETLTIAELCEGHDFVVDRGR